MSIDLEVLWFLVFGTLIGGYAILDGFDLGVGVLHLFAKGDRERRLMLNSIGPVWDGNEVWLVTAGGALFAGFPNAYATIFSSFYLPFMLLLAALIFRACAIEFRSKNPSQRWRQVWDASFCAASVFISFALGFVAGHLIQGIPLDEQGEVIRSQFALLQPYPCLVGATSLSLFMMHGSIYVTMKTEGDMHERARSWINPCIIFFVISYALTTIATLIYMPHMAQAFRQYPFLFAFITLGMLGIANIPREIHRQKDGWAFVSSAASILFLTVLYAVGTFPNLVRNSCDPQASVTIYNACSSALSLKYLLTIVCIGMPFVVAYTATIYWIFRGKVRLDPMSY